MSGSSGGENLDLMANEDIAEWSLVQRMSSATRLRARRAIAGLHLRMNARNERVIVRPITLSELVDHYRQRELKPDTLWKTHSTKGTYDGYLNKWNVPELGRLCAQPHQPR